MGKIIQIIPNPDTESPTILYGLDDKGNIWVLIYKLGGYVWEPINARII